MIHKPIEIKNLGLYFPHKNCFDEFDYQINYGDRIAIIGRNGSGKSSLLKMIAGTMAPSSGTIKMPGDAVIGYVPQVIDDYHNLSGGQRLNTALTKALGTSPNVLLLDEPTNHLDFHNRKSLTRMLMSYRGSLIIVSHDTDLLESGCDILWHIEDSKINIFKGSYRDYMNDIRLKRSAVGAKLAELSKQKKGMHKKLMQEQERASKRKTYGEKKYDGDKISLRSAQATGQNTYTKNKAKIGGEKEDLLTQLSSLRLPEIITPKFSLSSLENSDNTIVQVSDGTVGYQGPEKDQHEVLKNIDLNINGRDRIAIIGSNGSGKSTLIKAIIGDESIHKMGYWFAPRKDDIGYLDQHYNTLTDCKTVIEQISELVPDWPNSEVRRHLNDFLFRKNEEVNTRVQSLSGGEKARLSLAQIAARTPKLLILDEITNNLDLETKEHVLQVLKCYPGAIIVISHDNDFLQALEITNTINVVKFK